MFTKRLFQKAVHRHQRQEKGLLTSDDVNIRINVHYGIPSTASILAFDSIQRLLAIGTLDGRIKVIGGDNIEGLLISPKLLPYKYLEFLQNQGFLVSITNDNDIQVWNLERRSIACTLQWESNVTAFSVISGSSFMYDTDMNVNMHCIVQRTTIELALLVCHLTLDSIPFPENVVAVHGDKDLQLKNTVVHPNDVNTNSVIESTSHDLEEKEISALCWASGDGSIIAAGYIDGDILFWNTSKDSSIKDREAMMSQNVVKLQLSSAEKRLPVVVLHWLDHSKKSRNHREGQLFVYGGDEIGCDEVVTVLSLEWSSGIEAVKCTGRVDVTLTGSFADMILIPSTGPTGSDTNAYLFVLTNPGCIHIYDRDSLSSSDSQPTKEQPVSTVNFPACIPTVDPSITVAELFTIYGNIEAIGSKISAMSSTLTFPGNKKWPLTGGVRNNISFGEDNKVYRFYVVGYQDGSFNSENSGVSLMVLDLCSSTLRLAVGSECGLVQLYNLCSSGETSFHFVTETKSEVRIAAQVQGPKCAAIFDLHKSRVHALKFTNSGSKLIVAYECSRIAVLDMHSPAVTFITDSISDSPVISVFCKAIVYQSTKNTNESTSKVPDNCTRELVFVLTKDASVYVIDERHKQPLLKDDMLRNELSQDGSQESENCEIGNQSLDKNPSAQSLKELYVLLCCKDSLRIYPSKSVVRGENKAIYKVKLSKPCCWTTVFRKTDKVCGLVVLYETGVIEIRSLPDLELVKEFPLLSYLRWNVKTNMERMINSKENSHITMVNGCEVAFISLLQDENDYRIPESLPNLHDEVLAAAANAAISVSSDPKRKQGILGGIVKGLKGRKPNKSMCRESDALSDFSNLEDIFMKKPFPKPSTASDEQEAVELNIDDIEIDEPEPLPSTSSHVVDNRDKDKKKERERLLDDGDEIKPRVRTREEIIAKYRNVGDASSAAGEARNKLLERQEKLEGFAQLSAQFSFARLLVQLLRSSLYLGRFIAIQP
ncbi:syntaxin-binding protein 5-like [Phtheirospermum japonicum]|uniref:Syntaxin-binding protein 5-like n=1 Tax=Phtheirospermum japonicum TaxID=374723 RepID=A0A830BZR5_9LAMI|nr:syntaxin-binding protein 5-like [Phtheirospermum japonicum]